MSTLSSVIIRGTLAAMPAAGIPGRTYYTSDTLQVFYDDGVTWDNVTPSLASGSINALQQQGYVWATDIGAANAYDVELTPAPTLVAGSLVVMKTRSLRPAGTKTPRAHARPGPGVTPSISNSDSGPRCSSCSYALPSALKRCFRLIQPLPFSSVVSASPGSISSTPGWLQAAADCCLQGSALKEQLYE